jgi:hypothetical protein
MTRKIIWLITFFIGTPALIIWSFILLTWNTNSEVVPTPLPVALASTGRVLSASDFLLPEISSSITTADARTKIIRNYLSKYNSPLEPFSQHLVVTADKYSLDYRLLVAIAQQESNLCKRIPEESHNCWGFGIYGDKVTRFDSYPQAMDTVAKTLKRNYIDQGLDTPEEIMAKYTPPSLLIGGPWAKGVNQFLSDLE